MFVSEVPVGTEVSWADEPVIEVVTSSWLSSALEPLTMTFFQFGIFILLGWLLENA
jgi:hypothetical protein